MFPPPLYRYVPAVSYTIHSANAKLSPDDKDFINIKGMAIGDGAMDPPSQFNKFSDLLYYNGLANSKERKFFQQYETNIQDALTRGDSVEAFNQFDEMLNGDFIQPTYYMNVTGMTNYFNSQQGDCGSCEPEYYGDWVVDENIRSKIHVSKTNSVKYVIRVRRRG